MGSIVFSLETGHFNYQNCGKMLSIRSFTKRQNDSGVNGVFFNPNKAGFFESSFFSRTRNGGVTTQLQSIKRN